MDFVNASISPYSKLYLSEAPPTSKPLQERKELRRAESFRDQQREALLLLLRPHRRGSSRGLYSDVVVTPLIKIKQLSCCHRRKASGFADEPLTSIPAATEQ